MKNLKAHHHLAIVSMLCFGVVSVWTWGTAVFASSSTSQIEVWIGPPDSCPNIPGYQSSVPSGMLVDGDGNCYTPPPPPVDMCKNIAGDQSTIPAGYYQDSSENCYPQTNPAVDVCPNINGLQKEVPEGYTNNSNGDCVKPPADMCTNIDGTQILTPEGMQRTGNGVCFTPSATTPPQSPDPVDEDPWATPTSPRQPDPSTSGSIDLKNIPSMFESLFIPVVNAVPESVKEALRTIPPVVARTFPYWIFAILATAAGIMVWQALSEIAAIAKLTKLLKRERNIAEEKDNFVALASHYLRTPLTLMKGALDTAIATKETTPEFIQPLRSHIDELDAKVGEILKDVEGNSQLHQIEAPEREKDNHSFLYSSFFWTPIFVTFTIVIFANFLLGVVGDVELGGYNLLLQGIVFVAVSTFFYSAIRNRHLKHIEHVYREKLVQHEEAIDKARNDFIANTGSALASGLVAIAREKDVMKGSKAETYFVEGYSRFDHLLQKFSLLSQIQAGVPGQSEKFDIKTAIDNVILFYQPQLNERRITVVNNVKSQGISQRRTLFDFVLSSLIDNAIKFSHEGGTITIGSAPHQSTLTVRISDYGIGIPEEKMSQLFKPFSRGTSAMEFNYEGLGFSLFLDKIIMDYVGGSISAQSSDKSNTTFSITTGTSAAA